MLYLYIQRLGYVVAINDSKSYCSSKAIMGLHLTLSDECGGGRRWPRSRSYEWTRTTSGGGAYREWLMNESPLIAVSQCGHVTTFLEPRVSYVTARTAFPPQSTLALAPAAMVAHHDPDPDDMDNLNWLHGRIPYWTPPGRSSSHFRFGRHLCSWAIFADNTKYAIF